MLFHGQQATVELIVRVLACVAAGLGIRATARVFEVDPNTVLRWLVEAADQLLLAIEIGPRTLAMAQRAVPQVVQHIASTCMPLWLSDGFTGYHLAILGHGGVWHQPERMRVQGPAPKRRWLPQPGLL
jgi:hypothetical protein